MKIELKKLVRKNILELRPYSSARSEFSGKASVLLDANENAYGSPLPENFNRYPDPLQSQLKRRLGELKGVATENICIGNGSDELIDHIVRIFCTPSVDNVIVCPPTFKMYEVAAALNDISIKKVLLRSDFQLDVDAILKAVTDHTKIIFLCSPNNPTGNLMKREDIENLIERFPGIIVVDEAYLDFSGRPSLISHISENNNLIILQTLSKAWGMAGLRVGIGYADPEIIGLMMRVKMPYNVNTDSQRLALAGLENKDVTDAWRNEIIEQRKSLAGELSGFEFITNIYPSDSNFILIKVKNAVSLYHYLVSKEIIVRNQSSQPGLGNCLRVTVGTPDENKLLMKALKNYAE